MFSFWNIRKIVMEIDSIAIQINFKSSRRAAIRSNGPNMMIMKISMEIFASNENESQNIATNLLR